MNDRFDVISAFLDDEAFDPKELADALSHPEGRSVLLDLVALRHIVQPESDGALARATRKPQRTLAPALAAAAMLVALAGGYFAGQQRDSVNSSEPPAATRVVEAGGRWQDVPQGSQR
jgi:hypothetical protein